MDFWYERVIREMFDINEEATELRRRAATSRPPSAKKADDEDEQDGAADHEPDRPLR
jgi:hypothetical protein